MDKKKPSILKNSLNYGIILGFMLIIISVITYLFGTSQSKTGQNISALFQIVIITIGIVWGTKNLRTNDTNYNLSSGFSYGRALGSGTLISLFAFTVLSIYTYIFLKFIDPGEIEKMLAMAQDQLSEKGMSDEQVEMALSMSKKMMTPLIMSVSTIFSWTFYGFLISLLTSIFLKINGSTLPWTPDINQNINDNSNKIEDSKTENMPESNNSENTNQEETHN